MHTGKTSCFFCVVVLVCLFLVTLSYFAVSLTSSHHIPDSSPPLGWTHACFLSSRGISTPTVFCARLGTACQGAGLHPKIPARTYFFSPRVQYLKLQIPPNTECQYRSALKHLFSVNPKSPQRSDHHWLNRNIFLLKLSNQHRNVKKPA